MAQLSDDCFAFGDTLLNVDAALAMIAERLSCVVGTEAVPLSQACGRILAEDLVAAMNVPPCENSAVDGYAVRHADLDTAAETLLAITGRAAAGHPLGRSVGGREAIRIFTGAPLPQGADTVMMQEDCRVEGETVSLRPGLKCGANTRRAGEDVEKGSVALAAGRRLRPPDLGLAAALGCRSLPIRAQLRVALLSTGDEVRDPGTGLEPGQIYDANRVALAALLQRIGCRVEDLGIRPDREGPLADCLLEAASRNDLLVTSGGVSAGEEDHVRAAILRHGTLNFWRLAIKPGRPVALGQVAGVPLIGLPGNPVAAVITYAILARPLILRLSGAVEASPQIFSVRAGFSYRKKQGRREYVRVSLASADGERIATKYPRDGAGILSSIVHSDGLVVLGEEMRDLVPGTLVDFLPFSEVFG